MDLKGNLALTGILTGAAYKHACVATLSAPYSIGDFGGGFEKVPLASTFDPQSNFSNANSWYVAPVTGLYLILTRIRPDDFVDDGSGNQVSYGQGAHTSNGDGSFFMWGLTVPSTGPTYSRNGLVNFRIASFSAGAQIRMFAYADTAIAIADAEMNIFLLGAA